MNKICTILSYFILGVGFLILIGIAIFSPKTFPLSAKESFEKAQEVLESQKREAILIKISTGSIPRNISGPMSSLERRGKGDRWDIYFYSD